MSLLDGALFKLPEDLRHANLVESQVKPSRVQNQHYSGNLTGGLSIDVATVANDWEVSCILLQCSTYNTAGARAIVCTITPSGGSQYLAIPLTIGISTADKNTNIVALGGPGISLGRYTGTTAGVSFEAVSFPVPQPLYMTTGYIIDVFDANGVSAADTVDLTIIFREITEYR
jgi:hypothetical protein